MEVQRIAQQTNLGDGLSVNAALNELKKVSDADLHFYLVMRDTLDTSSPETRKAITLSQVEWERRKSKEANDLAYRTTLLSGLVGIAGVVLGALMAHWLAL